MGESKHTPGPWIYYADLPSTDPNWHIVTTTNKMRVLANVHIEPGNEMDEANARLIASAPDLLAALTLCQSALAMMIAPDAIKNTTVLNAFAQANEAEAKSRAALAKAGA